MNTRDLLDLFNPRKRGPVQLSGVSTLEMAGEIEKLSRTCSNLDTIIENSKDSIFVTDGTGTIVKINKAYEELSGQTRENLLGTNIRDMEGKIISEAGTTRVLKTKQCVTIEQKIFTTNRVTHVTTTPILDSDGEIVMAITNNRDLMEIDALKDRLANVESLASKYKQQFEMLRKQNEHSDLVAHDKSMLDVLYKADKIAKVDATILIMGETGTGKERLVHYIHERSNRRDNKLIKINCGAFSASLIESELFGYEKGSFTGANAKGKIGFFEAADGGTLFLDEIGELPHEVQVKLLRVLQEGEFFRIGGTQPIQTNVRLISATNRDLLTMVQNGLFRSDLYYRLNVTSITIPPLRERIYDIVPLATKFLNECNQKYGMEKSLSVSAYRILRCYGWPGNVRELKNVIEQALIVCEGDAVQGNELPISGGESPEISFLDSTLPLDAILAHVEAHYIVKAYKAHGTIRSAAKSLGMKPSKFQRKKKRAEESKTPSRV